MMPHLESLAAKMLKNRDFGYLKTVADMMAGLCGPNWSRLADEHKEQYLEQMKLDFHPWQFEAIQFISTTQTIGLSST